jgi:hypothetical protein
MSDAGIGAAEILLVRPVKEGSAVILGADRRDIAQALAHGLTPADIVMPMTSMQQIGLFGAAEV